MVGFTKKINDAVATSFIGIKDMSAGFSFAVYNSFILS
jgi:hypothetical protein